MINGRLSEKLGLSLVFRPVMIFSFGVPEVFGFRVLSLGVRREHYLPFSSSKPVRFPTYLILPKSHAGRMQDIIPQWGCFLPIQKSQGVNVCFQNITISQSASSVPRRQSWMRGKDVSLVAGRGNSNVCHCFWMRTEPMMPTQSLSVVTPRFGP